MNTAFHSASFGTTASASELSVIPNNNRQPSRSTTSCALRTAGSGIAAGVLDVEFDLPAQQAAFRVDCLGPELGAAPHLPADLAAGPGQRARHADLDRLIAQSVTQHDGRSPGSRQATYGVRSRMFRSLEVLP